MATATPIATGEVVGADFLNALAYCGWRDTTLVDIVSSITETDLIGVAGTGISIPANTLGTQRVLRITAICDILNNSGVNTDGVTFKVYYGGTAVASGAMGVTAGTSRRLIVPQFFVGAEGATNAQLVGGLAAFDGAITIPIDPLPAANTTKAWTDLTIDDTVAQNLRVTATLNANLATLEFRKRSLFVEVV